MLVDADPAAAFAAPEGLPHWLRQTSEFLDYRMRRVRARPPLVQHPRPTQTAAPGDQLLACLILVIDQAAAPPGPEVPPVRPHDKDAPVGWAGASWPSACR
jgi:hypothetical protein